MTRLFYSIIGLQVRPMSPIVECHICFKRWLAGSKDISLPHPQRVLFGWARCITTSFIDQSASCLLVHSAPKQSFIMAAKMKQTVCVFAGKYGFRPFINQIVNSHCRCQICQIFLFLFTAFVVQLVLAGVYELDERWDNGGVWVSDWCHVTLKL